MPNISIDTANKMLSLVRPITEQTVEAWEQIEVSREQLKKIVISDDDQHDLLARVAKDFERATNIINSNLDEFESLGCVVESYEEGIIDFPSEIDGDEIMLCWKLGEDEILHHHKRGETYLQRLLVRQVLEK